MELTRKKAIALCIEAWTIHAETGCKKSELQEKHRGIYNRCWFCEYSNQKDDSLCDSCPLPGDTYVRCNDFYFNNWKEAETIEDRKKYAKLFLAQIRSLK